jgi:hypothetical protein
MAARGTTDKSIPEPGARAGQAGAMYFRRLDNKFLFISESDQP